jgi:hypothetical protein
MTYVRPLGSSVSYAEPLNSPSHVIGTSVNAPVHVQFPFLVRAPGIGYVRWKPHVSGPWKSVNGMQ